MKAQLKYLANADEPVLYIPSKGGGDATEHEGNYSMLEVSIDNGRHLKKMSSLDVEGFRLLSQSTKVEDFYNDEQIQKTYHDEVKALVREVTGAARVDIFDDTKRSSSVERQKEKGIREEASIVHNDYTPRSGMKRLRDHLADDPDEAERLLQRRFAIFNVWRSIAGPIHNHPLTLCDASTVRPEELVSVERRAEDRIGELQLALHAPGHRWYYFPDMQMDEALMFKTFDSETDGRARFTIHSSFSDPDASPDSPPRESIETRCLVFF